MILFSKPSAAVAALLVSSVCVDAARKPRFTTERKDAVFVPPQCTEPPTRRYFSRAPTSMPITDPPTKMPVTGGPTKAPITDNPTKAPITDNPTKAPITDNPTKAPITDNPTKAPITDQPTDQPTKAPITPSTDGQTCPPGWDILQTYDLFTKENLSSNQEQEGKTFIGGSITNGASQQFGIKLSDTTDTTLTVVGSAGSGSSLKIQKGSAVLSESVSGAGVQYRTAATNRLIEIQQQNGNSARQQSGLAAVRDDMYDKLFTISQYLCGKADTMNGSSKGQKNQNERNAYRFVIGGTDSNKAVVFNLAENELFGNNAYGTMDMVLANGLSASDVELVVINVWGQSISQPNFNTNDGTWLGTSVGRGKTIWNFCDATYFNMGSRSIKGIVLAPLAQMNIQNAMEGATFVKSLTATGEVHLPVLESVCPWDPQPAVCDCPYAGMILTADTSVDDYGGYENSCPAGSQLCVADANSHNGVFQFAPFSTGAAQCTTTSGATIDLDVTRISSKTLEVSVTTPNKLLAGVYVEGQSTARTSYESCGAGDWLCQAGLNLVQLPQYLIVGTMNNADGDAVNVQNGDLGANVFVLSSEMNDNVDFDKKDVFLNNLGARWVEEDNHPNTEPDWLPGAGKVREYTSWTGDVAVTATCGKFQASNVELYGKLGVTYENSCQSTSSNSYFFPPGYGNGDDDMNGRESLAGRFRDDKTSEMSVLRQELRDLNDWVRALSQEHLWAGPDSGKTGLENHDYYEMNLDAWDSNGDGLAVIDLDVQNNDWKITNTNWVLESEIGTFGIFRLKGGKNIVLNQGTIMAGDGILGNELESSPHSRSNHVPVEFRAAFFAPSGFGKSIGDGDVVFNFNDVILNGVAFYDFVSWDSNSDSTNDNGKTGLSVQNGQGCAQFVGAKVTFSNVRFELCFGAGSGQGYEFSNSGGCTAEVSAPNNEDIGLLSLCVADCVDTSVMDYQIVNFEPTDEPTKAPVTAPPTDSPTKAPVQGCPVIDFDFSDLPRGAYLMDQYKVSHGITFRARAKNHHFRHTDSDGFGGQDFGCWTPDITGKIELEWGAVRVFDTYQPYGDAEWDTANSLCSGSDGDDDLGSPSGECQSWDIQGTPPNGGSVWNQPGNGGYSSGTYGDHRNCDPQGHVVIIQESPKTCPDDCGKGGTILVEFPWGADLHTINVLDVDESTSNYVTVNDTSGNTVLAEYMPRTEENGLVVYGINKQNVASLQVDYSGSGSLGKLHYTWCQQPQAVPDVYDVLDEEGFESNSGKWNDGGGDSKRYSDSNYAKSGTRSWRLRDNTNAASSMEYDRFNAAAYSHIRMTFDYYHVGFESSEDFFIETGTGGSMQSWGGYGDTATWKKRAVFTRGAHAAFDANDFYHAEVEFPTDDESMLSLRIRVDASDNLDLIYVDNVKVEGRRR